MGVTRTSLAIKYNNIKFNTSVNDRHVKSLYSGVSVPYLSFASTRLWKRGCSVAVFLSDPLSRALEGLEVPASDARPTPVHFANLMQGFLVSLKVRQL